MMNGEKIMTYATITAEADARGTKGVTLLTINRPQALNALNSQVLAELIDAFAAYQADSTQLCAILTGSGDKAFAAGADIKEMSEKPAAEFYLDDFFGPWTSEIVKKTRKPWIAAVNGFALGGGCELAMMADFIIASDKAKFGQPEIKLGVAPGMGGSQRLTRAIGKAKAMDLILTGRTIDAAEAERSGLVSRVVPADTLLDEANAVATTISQMSRSAARMAKEAVNRSFESSLTEGLLYERRLFHSAFATDDQTEGMAAFTEKRAPNFTHR
jgi:enoyl-CoA hydratase